MLLDYAIGKFRQNQESVFRDEATIERPSGTGTLNPATGEWVPDPPTLIHSGPCLMRGQRWEASEVDAGGEQVLLQHMRVKFPVDTPGQRDDIITWTASTYEPTSVGKTFVVRDAPQDGWQICTWFICEEQG